MFNFKFEFKGDAINFGIKHNLPLNITRKEHYFINYCWGCNKLAKTKSHGKFFCYKCKTPTWYKLEERICKYCNESFFTGTGKFYCSSECHEKMKKIQKKNHKPYTIERKNKYFDLNYQCALGECERNIDLNGRYYEHLSLNQKLPIFMILNPSFKLKEILTHYYFQDFSILTIKQYFTEFRKAQKRLFLKKLNEVKTNE